MKEIKPNTDLNKLFKGLNSDNSDSFKTISTIVDKSPITFNTPLSNAIYRHPVLSAILESIQIIDFSLYADEGRNGRPRELDSESKVVLTVQNLINISDSIGCGIACEHGNVYVYNKSYWEQLTEEMFKYFLGEVAFKSGFSNIHARKRKLNESLCEHFYLLAPFHKPDGKKDFIKINLENGTFHINTKRGSKESSLEKPVSTDFFMYRLPFEYEPNATAPQFRKYLDRVLPDKAAQKVLFEYCGYIFTSHLKLERILILYGSGSNGKSVFFDILSALLGEENISHFSMDKLCDDTGYYRANLPGKLVNYASEFGGKMDMQMFKRIVSNEPIDARNPYGKAFIVRDYGKFIFNTNKLPEVEHTEAFFRRPLIIPFKQKITGEEKDSSLAGNIISSELSGIFNLILEGLDRLLIQNDFSDSDLVNDEISNYKMESNSISLFIDEEGIVPSVNKKKRVKDLYERYTQYCRECGIRNVFIRQNFKKKLEELGFNINPKGAGRYPEVFCEEIDNAESLQPEVENDIMSLFNLNKQ